MVEPFQTNAQGYNLYCCTSNIRNRGIKLFLQQDNRTGKIRLFSNNGRLGFLC